MVRPLRLVVYDATQRARPPRALGLSWQLGTYLYRGLGRVDAAFGAQSFAEAFHWLGSHERERPIAELQFWGHGRWGRALIEGESLDRRALAEGHALHAGVCAFRERLSRDALVWFRTCETLGAEPGHDFASALSDFLGASVAGHTFVIGYFQSGLHCLRPGERPSWPASEGLARGTPAAPQAALESGPGRPNTITCLTGSIPGSIAGPYTGDHSDGSTQASLGVTSYRNAGADSHFAAMRPNSQLVDSCDACAQRRAVRVRPRWK